MKKILFTIILFVYSCYIAAQVLYTENFDNYTLGNVATDFSGQTPGQGGWHTLFGSLNTNATAANFQIENETNKGKVLTITTGPVGSHGTNRMFKKNFDVLWNQRTQGNNVLKFEIEIFVPNYPGNPSIPFAVVSTITLYTTKPKILAGFLYNHFDGLLRGVSSNGLVSYSPFHLTPTNNFLYTPDNQWYQLFFFIDYDNNKAYVEIPKLGIVKKVDVFDKLTPPDTMSNYPPTELNLDIGKNIDAVQEQPSFLKYDNIKITALKSVPPHLLTADNFLAEKFNLYPNPANSMVNITNAENMQIQQITVYDVAGKQLSTQTYNNETEIQLNIEHFASGTYMLHLQTNQGTAVKKLVKK
ncbi:T9SS type A sorting domain-containing protein [Flavobacterium sp. CBA20B-1]|uniref:T9SS type A sorting domain-containing protein n=1 Tax=unclassified Flavobacterium TaxID=196869 RepID=UPI0022257D0F|nr:MULTISPECIES: T9SS type A sorting domain-containing protein [unclassified Flavobacterium]WCM41154.1 T9SS type A sorting domain-containing protein [Flavobacterium sp. CBA20B-1]